MTYSEMGCNDVHEAWQQFLHRVPRDVIGDNCVAAPSLDNRFNTMSMFLRPETGSGLLPGDFVGNLRDLVDERKTNRSRWNELIDVKGSFEPSVECCRLSVTGPEIVVQLRVLNVYKWSSCISQLKREEVFVRTEYKDLHNVRKLSIVTEVWTAGRLIFDMQNGAEDEVLSLNVNGPVPIAYNSQHFGLYSNGELKIEHPSEIEHVTDNKVRKSSKKSLRYIWKKLNRNYNNKTEYDNV